MKPQMVMLEVRPMDACKRQISDAYKFPYIEIDDLVFLRLPKGKQTPADLDLLRSQISLAAQGSATGYVRIPDAIGAIDKVMTELSEAGTSDIPASEMKRKLAVICDEIAQQVQPTNKTFVFLPHDIRFLEIKEKWEDIPKDIMKEVPKTK